MAENIINKFLYTGAGPGEKLATQQAVKNMSYGQIGKNILDEGAFGFGKNLKGFDPNYTGKGAIPRNTTLQKMTAPFKYSAGAFNLGDKASNLAGGTSGQRQLYEKFLQSPVAKTGAGIMNFAPKVISTLASLPAQAAFFTLSPTEMGNAELRPEDFRALAEAEGMTYGSSPITSSPINLDERYADQLAPGAYGKMGENVYTKMDDGSTRMDPYASQKFYDDAIFNDYFATNRYEDFNPRVGNMPTSTPQIGDAISRTNVQGMDYEMDPGAFTNPNIQPSQNMFQRAGNFVKDLELEEYLPFIGERSLTGMLGRGIGNLFQNIAPARYGTSQRAYNALSPQGRSAVGGIYGPSGIMSGYNAVSAFGRGPVGAINNRISNIQNRKAAQTDISKQTIKDLYEARNEIAGVSMKGRNYTGFGKTGMGRDPNDVTGGAGPSGGSSKIVCTMMNDSYGFGNFRNKIWLKHSKDLPKEYEAGYHKIFLPLVKFAKEEGKLNKVVKKTLEHIARHRTLDLKQEMKGKTHTLGRVYRKILEPICFLVGKASMFVRRK
jgi:hypothetical protein|tara:strand:- start:849 stop:2495 length:1647 start_codon:yes stop_codon:yes gene_type:complete